jgi:hypothetical protein
MIEGVLTRWITNDDFSYGVRGFDYISVLKTLVGTSKNAVLVQILAAMIAILLLKYMKMLSGFGQRSFSTMIALLRFNLFWTARVGVQW